MYKPVCLRKGTTEAWWDPKLGFYLKQQRNRVQITFDEMTRFIGEQVTRCDVSFMIVDADINRQKYDDVSDFGYLTGYYWRDDPMRPYVVDGDAVYRNMPVTLWVEDLQHKNYERTHCWRVNKPGGSAFIFENEHAATAWIHDNIAWADENVTCDK